MTLLNTYINKTVNFILKSMQASLFAKSFWTTSVKDYICLSHGQKGI